MSEEEYKSDMMKYWILDAASNLGKYSSLILGIGGIVGEKFNPEDVITGAGLYLASSMFGYISKIRVQEIQRSKLEKKLEE